MRSKLQQKEKSTKEANPKDLAISKKAKKIKKGGQRRPGRPRGLKNQQNCMPPSGEWPDDQRCVQLVMCLKVLGQYMEYHKTGPTQSTQDNKYNQDVKLNEKVKDKLNNIELVRIFANAQWSNICNNKVKNQKCFVYFFDIGYDLIKFTLGEPQFPEVNLEGNQNC